MQPLDEQALANRAHRAGPTDITDELVRREAKKSLVWLGVIGLAALVVVLAQPLLVIFGGMVFAAMIDGGARLLGRVLPIGRGWRIGIVLLLTGLFLVWLTIYAGSQLATQAAQLPAIVEAQAVRGLGWLREHGIHVNLDDFRRYARQSIGGVAQVTHLLGGLVGAITTVFIIIVLGIYVVAEPRLYQRGFAWMLPVDSRAYFHGTAALMGKTLRRLLFGRLIGMTIEGVTTWLLLQIGGVPMAALLGVLTGVLVFLPNIGAPISGLLMVMVGFSVGTNTGLYCIIVYIVVQMVDGNIVVPMVAKKTVDLAPAVVLGMQLIMGALFGILGLALADPMVAMIKVVLERQSLLHELHEVEEAGA
ncbi:MAG: AI-2E family transporter [Novosphingobium sp.]|nr:AI-2E family transporter [Novosphingobium sp.]